ncbi:hypothetical protein [Botrimarina mediterranea]|uniref:hypothetical protein n=1 Tax=Botrimarina mediterranea TaxID=2528022 RepID=UPI0011898234|nr:hypothetical protein K2D_25260 [Planctomycetes bacterium K2D]
MIDPTDALEATRLLSIPGATLRSVAKATGLSKTTVGRIARREWCPLAFSGGANGRRPEDPTPLEIHQRAREVRLRGGGELVAPEIAKREDLAEDTAANRAYAEQRPCATTRIKLTEILGGYESGE